MIPAGLCSRADLLRVMACEDAALLQNTAELLGYIAPEPIATLDGEIEDQNDPTNAIRNSTTTKEQESSAVLSATPFWRAQSYVSLSGDTPTEAVVAEQQITWCAPKESAAIRYLASWRELQPRLRTAIAARHPGGRYDWDRIVQRLGQGRILDPMPRLPRRGLGTQLQIIVDRSERLTPYWQDQAVVISALAKAFPNYAFDFLFYHDGQSLPCRPRSGAGSRRYTLPPEGSLTLVLGDLGSLAKAGAVHRMWEDLGSRLRAAGCRRLALLPAAPSNLLPRLSQHFDLLSWESPSQLGKCSLETLKSQAERLLRLLSPARRIEPGLLRAVRLAMGLDAGAESLFWQHPAMSSTHSVAGTLDAKVAKALQADFAKESFLVQQRVLACIRNWRTKLPGEIWFEELLGLPPAARDALPDPDEYELACQFIEQFSQRGRGMIKGSVSASQIAWFDRVRQRLPDTTWNDQRIGPALQRFEDHLHCNDPDYRPGHDFDPGFIEAKNEPVRRVSLHQQGGRLLFGYSSLEQSGSPVGSLQSQNGLIRVEVANDGQIDRNLFWSSGQAPGWADQWGVDDYGAWVSFSLRLSNSESITQRLRWIAPGEFQMGSPPEEAGRDDDEGPQHKVALTQGYWLFDTACTQALWEAVMRDNPSRFQSPTRPVEQVSWEDCQAFLKRLNLRIPELELGLPSEAQWEYGCRAGSEFATYAGALAIQGERDASDLDPIAWYGGNSGVDFELENGYDSSDWKEKQYPHKRAGTHPVGLKRPNGWGLYDMLGNVWEWCADGQREYKTSDEYDPQGPAHGERVFRGGSCYDFARYTRCAFRVAFDPGIRYGSLGFRGSRVQAGAELVKPQPLQAERRTAAGSSGAALRIDLRTSGKGAFSLPADASAMAIRSDRSLLSLRCDTRAAWASAQGRDRFGLWAEIDLGEGQDRQLIQRLRWIVPGEFKMGSPPKEAGRVNDEGPQHQVALTEGYWLFDTPCTQALWEAVMGDNPSRFQSPTRPVEKVSWDDCQAFLKRLNERVPGLELSLPSEAQWEYACRAGSESATYAGALSILGERNAPDLDPIAWYGGNSGLNFELENGHDSSDWREKQHPHQRAGTHPVGQKRPNDWGLYDMLGNVWEWCADGRREYKESDEHDPQGPVSGGRVFRGGSWDGFARNTRCAYRYAYDPDFRYYDLGFRCSRVQS